MILAALFYNPYPLHMPSVAALWLVIPLCACVAIVYKALRVSEVRRLPLEAAKLLLYMVSGLVVLGAGLWALVSYWPR
jgi:hypothetical protein